MATRVCPIKTEAGCGACKGYGTLRDRKGVDFYVRCEQEYQEILNSRPLWLADEPQKTAGVDHLLLYFTMESKEQCAGVIKAYQSGCSAPKEFTRGLYQKGVI